MTPSIRRAAPFAFVLAAASIATLDARPARAQQAAPAEAAVEVRGTSSKGTPPNGTPPNGTPPSEAPLEAEPASLPRGPRIGLIPGAGVGIAGFTNAESTHPGFVGLTFTQIELLFEVERWGGFLRGAFYSSGQDGRWTAPSLAAGGTYRFFGDGETSWGLVGRGGLIWQNWHASTAGCDIPYFIPENCKARPNPPTPGVISVPAPIYTTTASSYGLLAGARLELPVKDVYMALGGEVVAVADVSHASPGTVLQALLSFSISFRSRRWNGEIVDTSVERARYREQNK